MIYTQVLSADSAVPKSLYVEVFAMKYIPYHDMKEFYTIPELCRLFEMDKPELRQYADKYAVGPVEDQFGNWGFLKSDVRKLHNAIYKEQRGYQPKSSSSFQQDPWA